MAERIVEELPRFSQRIGEPLPGRPALRGRPRVRARPAPPPARAAGARRPGRAPGAGRRPDHAAARLDAAAVARLPHRGLRRGRRGPLPDPPLHRRRDRPRARDAVAHGHRAGRRLRGRARAASRVTARLPLGWLAKPARRGGGGRAPGVAGALLHEGMESLAHPAHVRELAGTALRDAGTVAKLHGVAARRGHRPARPARRRPPRRLVHALPARPDQDGGPPGRREGQRHPRRRRDRRPARPTWSSTTTCRRTCTSWCRSTCVRSTSRCPRELGNDFALILLALPVGIEERDERLREVKARMDAIKDSHEGPISYGLLSAMGRTPPAGRGPADRLLHPEGERGRDRTSRARASRVYLAGTPVSGVLVWAPCSGSIGMTVSIFSYAGEVTVGFMADSRLVPDPAPLVRAFDARAARALPRHAPPRSSLKSSVIGRRSLRVYPHGPSGLRS